MIISHAGVSRGRAYDCLHSLAARGLVSVSSQNNRQRFSPAHPRRIRLLLNEKRRGLNSLSSALDAEVSRLEALIPSSPEPRMLLFHGREGLKSLFDDCLESTGEVLVLGAYTENSAVLKYFLQYVLPRFHKARVKRDISFRYLYPQGSAERARQVLSLPLTRVRILPLSIASVSAVQVRGDKVDLILWSGQGTGVTIDSRDIAQQQRDYFNFLWAQSKPLRKAKKIKQARI